MGDDAAGPFFVRTFDSRWELPDHVSVEDLGTPGPELAHYLMGLDALIVVDAVRAEGPPGELRIYRREEILHHAPVPQRSAHDPSLRGALWAADLAGQAPTDVVLVGVIPERIELHTGLSAIVRGAMSALEASVLEELARLGIRASARIPPADPEIWWEG